MDWRILTFKIMQKIYNFYLAYYTCINAIIILSYIILWRIVFIPNIVLAEEQTIVNNNNTLYKWLLGAGITIIGCIGFYYLSDFVPDLLDFNSVNSVPFKAVAIYDAAVFLNKDICYPSVKFVNKAILQISGTIMNKYATIVSKDFIEYGFIEDPKVRMMICYKALFHDTEWFNTNLNQAILLTKGKERFIDNIIQICASTLTPAVNLTTPTKQIALNIGLLMNTLREQGYIVEQVEHCFISENSDQWLAGYLRAIERFHKINKHIYGPFGSTSIVTGLEKPKQ